jgi:hypothetical protein
MSTEPIPVVVPCNVCGCAEFELGPSSRTSITKRKPLCSECNSLERHRVVRAVFDAIPQEMLQGTRCLQFSPDPALDRARFVQFVLSVWGGPNSLDMQDIALPDGSFDWIYSSHVINHIPNAHQGLREMLRVVGNGCVVMSVGGTVANYQTKASTKSCGGDRQWKEYGTLYADELQEALPHASVLEIVAADPCSVSLDCVYFISLDEAKLTKIAEACVARNAHARVFPSKRATPIEVSVPRSRPKPVGAWQALSEEIEAWKAEGGAAQFWLRDDDATVVEPRLVELIDLCEQEGVPLAMAIIPLPMTPELVNLVSSRAHLTPIQHGFDHQNREPSSEKAKSEFPVERNPVETIRTIQLGWHILHEAFGARALPVFCPPWGTMADKFRGRLVDLGFKGYSGSRISGEIHRQGPPPAGLRLASAHVAVNLPHRNRKDVLPEERILQTLTEVIRGVRRDRVSEPIGIMTHHWGVDGEVRQFLQKVFSLTRDAGGTWTSSAELFTPGRSVSPTATRDVPHALAP